MSKLGRQLQPGDDALTNYNGPGNPRQRGPLLTRVRILARKDGATSQSGTVFQIAPLLRNGTKDSWYDADWFEPVPPPLDMDREAALDRMAADAQRLGLSYDPELQAALKADGG